MDEDRTYLETTIYIRDGFESYFNMSDKMSDKMNDKEKMFYSLVLQAFQSTDFITTKIMSKTTGMAASTTRRYLTKFCNLGILCSDGKNRGTKYYLDKSNGK